MAEAADESPKFANLGEAIEALKSSVPQDIQKRYFIGPIWDDFMHQTSAAPDDIITTILGCQKVKRVLAAYLVNMVVQSLFQELCFGQRVDMKSLNLVDLSPREVSDILLAIQNILYFVKMDLGVNFEIDPEVNQPHVIIENRNADGRMN